MTTSTNNTLPPDLSPSGRRMLRSRNRLFLAFILLVGISGVIWVIFKASQTISGPNQLFSLIQPLGLILAGIIFGLLGIWLKEREVAARIAGTGTNIRGIEARESTPHPLLTIRSDPVVRFVNEVNLILEELEHSRQELQESRDRYRLLFESGNDFLLVCAIGREETPYRILDANVLACRSLGYTRDELFALAPGSAIFIRSDFRKGDQQLHSADLIPREGSRIPVEASIHRITLEGTPAILIIARDVTERRQAEKELMDYRYRLEELVTQRTNELRAANESLKREMKERERLERERREAYQQIEKNIEQFAVLTDHIRNPLQVVQGMADLIDDPRAEEIQEQIRQIKAILKQLDEGWVGSVKVREYLERYR